MADAESAPELVQTTGYDAQVQKPHAHVNKKMRVTELRQELLNRGLDTTGKKGDLISRLEEAMASEPASSTDVAEGAAGPVTSAATDIQTNTGSTDAHKTRSLNQQHLMTNYMVPPASDTPSEGTVTQKMHEPPAEAVDADVPINDVSTKTSAPEAKTKFAEAGEVNAAEQAHLGCPDEFAPAEDKEPGKMDDDEDLAASKVQLDDVATVVKTVEENNDSAMVPEHETAGTVQPARISPSKLHNEEVCENSQAQEELQGEACATETQQTTSGDIRASEPHNQPSLVDETAVEWSEQMVATEAAGGNSENPAPEETAADPVEAEGVPKGDNDSDVDHIPEETSAE
ncbi:hypothetical protein CYMTET_29212 [Cymbomonas tetramitiformis]|uniref:SAP domain-containing protein n=1 Tax=Cymbomonas tetramitiformis TaxID=36881 RepID=A0AAE0FLH0_9CHLO|nr:hypothetical protein CYMTET_29212 [Cymbomonas tetramitiformis]|eukprot:gene2673-3446_t